MKYLSGSDIEQEILALMRKAEELGMTVKTINGPSLSIEGKKIEELFGRRYFISRTNTIAVS